MTMHCMTFSAEVAARRAVAALRATGVPARDLRVLIGTRLGNTRQEPVGGYGGPFGHAPPVGTFGGGVVRGDRARQIAAVAREIASRSAISVFFSPSAASNTIRDRCASACALGAPPRPGLQLGALLVRQLDRNSNAIGHDTHARCSGFNASRH